MMQVVNAGEPFTHKIISIHKRIPKQFEPPTYWLTITMPWKSYLYDLNSDEMKWKHPRYCFGFRFWRA